jgi:hypothetical protein
MFVLVSGNSALIVAFTCAEGGASMVGWGWLWEVGSGEKRGQQNTRLFQRVFVRYSIVGAYAYLARRAISSLT